MLEGCVFRLPLSIPKYPAAHLVWFLPFEHRCKIQEIGSASYPGYPVEETRGFQPSEPDYRPPHPGVCLGESSAPVSCHSSSMRGPLLHGHVRLRGELPLSFVGVQHVRHRCRLECGATS